MTTEETEAARENSNQLRLKYDIKDIEYERILLLKANNTYAVIAKSEGKAWTGNKIKSQMKKVYAKLNKDRSPELPRICCHYQIFEILEMIKIIQLF